MTFEMAYGKLIRARRLHLGLQMRELQRLTGVTHPTLKRIENGQRVRISSLVLVLDALDIYELPQL